MQLFQNEYMYEAISLIYSCDTWKKVDQHIEQHLTMLIALRADHVVCFIYH